jgi:LytR cell envelope-related transcriptional attenuator
VTTGAVSGDREEHGHGAGDPAAPGPGAPAHAASPGTPGPPAGPGGPAHAAPPGAPGPPADPGGEPAPRHMAAAPAEPPAVHPRPASRRSRQLVRRRGDTGEVPAVAAARPDGPPPGAVGGARGDDPITHAPPGVAVPAPPARPRRRLPAEVRRRRQMLLAGMGALSAAGAALAFGGLTMVRNSTVGRYEQAAAPTDPGYQAYVVTTPTMAVLHKGPDGDLAGASLLALEPGDDGGAVIVVPPSTIVPRDAASPTTLADIYRTDGAGAASAALAEVVTVAVSEHVEVDDAQWSRLVAPVEPVSVSLERPVGEWPAGEVALDAAAVGRFLAALGGGETDLDRTERQQQFWGDWLSRVSTGGDDAVPGEVESGLGRFVRGIAGGRNEVSVLPVARDGPGGAADARFRTDGQRVAELVAEAVPFPRSPSPGARIRVRLLNGTDDQDLTSRAVASLVAAGAEVVIAGNASSFDVAETTFAWSHPETEALAVWLQAKLGGKIEQVPEGEDAPAPSDDEIDVTVILGDDAGDLIGR